MSHDTVCRRRGNTFAAAHSAVSLAQARNVEFVVGETIYEVVD